MTIKLLREIFVNCNIPDDVTLMSDSMWECDETDMNGVYYNQKTKTIIFTQGNEKKYDDNPDYKALYFYDKTKETVFESWNLKCSK